MACRPARASSELTVMLPSSSAISPPHAWMKSSVFTDRPSYCDSCSVRQSASPSMPSQDSRRASQSAGASGIISVLRYSSWPLVFCGRAYRVPL